MRTWQYTEKGIAHWSQVAPFSVYPGCMLRWAGWGGEKVLVRTGVPGVIICKALWARLRIKCYMRTAYYYYYYYLTKNQDLIGLAWTRMKLYSSMIVLGGGGGRSWWLYCALTLFEWLIPPPKSLLWGVPGLSVKTTKETAVLKDNTHLIPGVVMCSRVSRRGFNKPS